MENSRKVGQSRNKIREPGVRAAHGVCSTQLITETREERAWWKGLPGQFQQRGQEYPPKMRLYQEELLISQMQSGYKRTHSGLSSSPMPSMTRVLSTLPLCHAQEASTSPSLTQKCCHNPIHCILTQKYPTEKKKKIPNRKREGMSALVRKESLS